MFKLLVDKLDARTLENTKLLQVQDYLTSFCLNTQKVDDATELGHNKARDKGFIKNSDR